MSVPVNNFINVDYPICSVYSIPASTTIKLFTGYLFPANENLDYVTIEYGDGTTTTTAFSSTSASFTNNVNAIIKYPSFIPVWDNTFLKSAKIPTPKFTSEHTYQNNGEYQVNVTLVTDKGIGYRGTPVTVTVNNAPLVEIPEGWESTALQYQTVGQPGDILTQVPTNLTDGLIRCYSLPQGAQATSGSTNRPPPGSLPSQVYNNVVASPVLSSTVISVSATPIEASFILLNVAGRTDVDYIEWSFGDGSTKVIDFRGGVVYPQFVTQKYSYPILPVELSYTPTATIYLTKDGVKTKVTVTGNQVSLSQRYNIIPSIALEGETGSNYGFTIQPWLSPNVLTKARFTFDIQKDLQYILMDFDDGKFDIIPATYSPSLSGIRQTVDYTHEYESTNNNRILPSAIFVYKNSSGVYTTKNYRSKRFVEYGRDDLTNIYGNYFFAPTVGTNGYRKFNNITVQPLYRDVDSAVVDIVIRLDIGFPKQILAFEKIIWTINGERIVQDKQTSKHFGYLTVKNVGVPYTNFSINADLYGIPAVYSQGTSSSFNLTYLKTYNYELNINDYRTSLFVDAQNAFNSSLAPVEIPTQTITISGDTTIIETPIIDVGDTETQEVKTYTSRAYVFDRAFVASNPAANFLNRNNPSTVASFEPDLETKREVGFFRPSKASTIVLDSGKFSFVVNLDRVDTDTIYYVPDPYKYGSETETITFNSEKASFKKGYSFGRAGDEPNTTEDSTSFYGYISTYNNNKDENLSELYDEGYIHDIKYDIFGNEYGLVKDNDNFRRYVEVDTITPPIAVVFNGHKFFDSYFGEGTQFDYYTPRDFPNINTYVPGISTNTGALSTTNYTYKINFGSFIQPAFPTNPTPIDIVAAYASPPSIRYVDGGVFAISDTIPVTDTISSDLSSNQYPGTGSFYYTSLIEAGVRQAIPYIRPLYSTTISAVSAVSALFTQNVVVSGNNGITDFDCGLLEGKYPSFDYKITNSLYLSSILPTSITQYVTGGEAIQNKIDRDNLGGTIYIKTQQNEIVSFIDAFAFATTKYGAAATELSSVHNFDLSYNTYFIQTPSYLIIDKIEYNGSVFESPRTPSTVIEYNSNSYNAISNRFKYKDDVYFAVLSAHNTSIPLNISIIPQIYRFGASKFELVNTLAYSSELLNTFTLSSNVLYTEACDPKLTYNEDIDMFNLSYLLKDQNKTPSLISVDFVIRDVASIKDVRGYNFVNGSTTVIFNALSALSTNFTSLTASTTPTLTSAGIVL